MTFYTSDGLILRRFVGVIWTRLFPRNVRKVTLSLGLLCVIVGQLSLRGGTYDDGFGYGLATATQEPKRYIDIPEHVDTWDEYFLWMATAASIKSKDPRCRVGAVIASQQNVLLSTGFNGLARGVYDDKNILDNPDEKLKVICHAEQNAILNAARIGVAVEGATIFVTKFPCLTCCNAIIQAGITRIHTHDERFWDDDPFDKDHTLKRNMLHQARITVDASFHSDFAPQEQITPQQKKKPMPVGAPAKRRPSEG